MTALEPPPTIDAGPAAGRSGARPTLGRGLAVFAVYVVVTVVAQLISGVDYDAINASASNVVGFVIVPIGLGIVAILAFTARWGWWHALFHERERLSTPRWLRLLPVLIAAPIVANLIGAPWADWSANVVILLLVGCAMVGFAEEIVFRGYVLVGARSRYSETGAWFVSSAAFALFHGENILLGQAVGTTIRQVALAFVMGGALYLVRRVSGLLVVGMVLHGLWDFAFFVAAGPGHGNTTADVTSGAVVAGVLMDLTLLFTIVALVVVFRRRGTAHAGPATT